MHLTNPRPEPRIQDSPEWVTLLRRRATEQPDLPAFTFLSSRGEETATWTFSQLDLRARRFEARLLQANASGRPVLLVLPSSLEYIAAFFGCLYAGAIAVPILPPRPHRPEHRLSAVAADSGAQIALTDARLKARVQDTLGTQARVFTAADCPEPTHLEPRRPAPDALAFLQYTSGSTADPKGVQVSHAHLLANQRMMQEAFTTKEDFSVVGWLPLHHDMGLIGNVLHPLYQGTRCVLMAPETFLMRPIRWLEAIHRYRATTSGAPNFAYDLCVDRIKPADRAQLDLSCWRTAYDGAEPIRQSTLQRFCEAFSASGFSRSAFTPCYGLAEATLLVCADSKSLHESRSGPVSCGICPEGTEILAVNPTTCGPLADKEEGELWVRGPAVAGGYFKRPELSQKIFKAQLSNTNPHAPTYLRTGDLGYIEDGSVYITGRLKDLIIIGGQNHHPQDVERFAERADPRLITSGCAAFSQQDAHDEQVVLIAELHRRAAKDISAIRQKIRDIVLENTGIVLGDVQLIRQGSLPRTSSGKVRRHACRDAYTRGDLSPVTRLPA